MQCTYIFPMTELLKEPKLIGTVIHYYGRPHAAIVRFSDDIPIGTHVHFAGVTTDFEEDIDSMEYDHRPITLATQGQEVGVHVTERVREGDHVYLER